MEKAGPDSNLDILRSVAVLAVLATHLMQVTAGLKLQERVAYGMESFSLGIVGVLLFFVHTSLVLMQSLERTGAARRGWPIVAYFYIRRAFRIYPLSICLVLASIAFSIPPNALGTPYHWEGVRWVAGNVLLVQNLTGIPDISSPLWSLPYEVQMYLVLPVLFLLLAPVRSWGRLAAIYVAGLIVSPFSPVLRYVPCFLAGVVAWRLLGRVRPRLPAWLWCPAIVLAVLFYVATPYSTGRFKDVMICAIVGGMIPLFRTNRGVISAVAARIAKYSYGIYLCHTPILWLFYRKLALPAWQRPIWVAAAIAAVSVACYYAIERPMIELGTRIANRVPVRNRMRTFTLSRRPELPQVECE
jgi:peptidoglycan/LPS O-acetylase OafA/YrhL